MKPKPVAKVLEFFRNIVSGLFTFIAILALTCGIPMCLFVSPGPFWPGFFICILICVIVFGYAWLAEKIRRNKLSPEERAAEDEETKRREKNIEKATYMYGNNTYNSWIVQHAKEDYSNKINDIIYKKMDEMIEQAEDPDTKIMLLKKKNKMLEEDSKKHKS